MVKYSESAQSLNLDSCGFASRPLPPTSYVPPRGKSFKRSDPTLSSALKQEEHLSQRVIKHHNDTEFLVLSLAFTGMK